MARLLTIMGSGETAPTMIKTHRRLMEAVGATGDGDAVLLDTPYGFQENADDISTKAQEYFRASVGHPIDVASWRRGDSSDTVARERSLAAVADASYVFTGPGSPTYALDQWRGTPLPGLLADKLRTGGAVTFASAAALTLGVATVPVYEIYKAGFAPWWVEGLDLLSEVGLHVALIPHYDNAEGGHHDTRFCYLGERRLSAIEPDLPEGAWVLGVDEHTALVLDLDAGTATVEGNGTVTLRAAGVSSILETGTTVPLADLHPTATAPSPDATPQSGSGGKIGTPDGRSRTQNDRGEGRGADGLGVGLGADTERLVAAYDAAIDGRDVTGAVAAVLDLEQALVDWSADTLQSDERDRARAALRRMIVRLGEVAEVGAQDPRAVVGPYVEAVLDARVAARSAGQYDLADGLRDRLTAAGIEVRDTPDGAEWLLGDS
ncbi:CysS/YqeB C-terminal domain-containing protein [Actinospongicola halichondriae]|uniref:CysS/YqeB C-terminal domain-containing protein n=1 Tax=Actinospongicola halichondriae TaxID=3236844 RepID=UPI003D37BC52